MRALELRHAAHHGQHQLAGRGRRVEPEVQDAERDALPVEPGDDLQQVRHRAGEAVELRHHEHVALAHEVERGLKLRPGRDAGHLFGEGALDAGRREVAGLSLETGDLFRGRRPGVSDDHGPAPFN